MSFAAAEHGVTAHVFVGVLGDVVIVGEPDRHHLQRVRRIAVGEHVTAADGTGRWRRYEVARVDADALELRAVADVAVEPEPRPRITAAVALIARPKLESVAAQLSELGVAALVPVRAERCVVRWDDAKERAARSRLRTIARESAMQCRRARPMEVCDAVAIDALFATPGLLVADYHGTDSDAIAAPGPDGYTLLSGPEGGFSEREQAAFRAAGVTCYRLGNHVLRAETAPTAFVGLLTQRRR